MFKECYPHGSVMPGRSFTSSSKYRYGYQGQFAEKDEETGLNSFEFRDYDNKLGLWTSVDRLSSNHPGSSPYMGMGNNPIVYGDRDGRDIIVLNVSNGAIFNAGHLALLVENPKGGWTFVSKEGREKGFTLDNNVITGGPSNSVIQSYPSIKDYLNSSASNGYDRGIRIKTTPEQDNAALAAASRAVRTNYNFVNSNCADAVSSALKAAGLDPGYSKFKTLMPIPNIRFNQIANNNFHFNISSFIFAFRQLSHLKFRSKGPTF